MEAETKTEVYEVHGRPADERRWDFLVCRSLGDALWYVQSAMEDAEEGEIVSVKFMRYTPAQLAEVVEE
jgi:hypothetical protein